MGTDESDVKMFMSGLIEYLTKTVMDYSKDNQMPPSLKNGHFECAFYFSEESEVLERSDKLQKNFISYSQLKLSIIEIAKEYDLITSVFEMDERYDDEIFDKLSKGKFESDIYYSNEVNHIENNNLEYDKAYTYFCLTSQNNSDILLLIYRKNPEAILVNTEVFPIMDAKKIIEQYF